MGNLCSCCKKQGKDPPKDGKGEDKSSNEKKPDGMEIPSIADEELQYIDEEPPNESKKQPEVIPDAITLSSMCNYYAIMDCTPATVKKALDVDERLPEFVSPGAWDSR
ncbi:uncharacterized protein LOC135935222 [Cloeon dipterum]|uniref:uncharacterized protein LOC135935222 n=1 Tax=Cloeon dipterum TaxID=197152 RepID=UPI0032203DC3